MYDRKILADNVAKGKLFGRHFVSMVLTGKFPDGTPVKVSYSAFLFAIDGDWFVMTAGHNISNIKSAFKKDLRLDSWDFNDRFAGGPYAQTVPSGIRLQEWKTIYSELDPTGIDLAATPLSKLHAEMLKANNLLPLNFADDYLRLRDRPCDHVLLVGIAEQTTGFKSLTLHQTMYIIPGLGIAPDDVSPVLGVNPDRLCVSIDPDDMRDAGLTSIEGTSGGPVFGIWFSADRESFDYAAIGIQSGWDPQRSQIAMSSLSDVSHTLAERMGAA